MGRRRRKTLVAKVGPGTGGGSQTLVVGGPDDAGDGGLDARGGPANYSGGKGATAVVTTRAGRGELERLPELPLAVLLRDQLQQRRVASGLPDPCAGAPS